MNIFEEIAEKLEKQGFNIVASDFERPWGGFFVIDETQAKAFVAQFFPGFPASELVDGRKVSPKILAVAPHKRLSWQYHFRRSEVWTVVNKKVGVMRSDTDEEAPVDKYQKGDVIVLDKGERHRLIGLEDWGVVAEIWQHTDPDHPSDEDDIVRLQDDFGRTTPVSQNK